MKENESKYEKAIQRVDQIKGWYFHLFIFMAINIIYALFNFGVFDGGRISGYIPWWSSLTMLVGWGLGLFGHWTYVFKGDFYLGKLKKWEERKIREYLEREEKESKKFTQND